MIELFIALILAWSCSAGQPIDDWYAFAQVREMDTITASIRVEDSTGVRWIWLFGDDVLFVTNLDSQHGYCARLLDGD